MLDAEAHRGPDDWGLLLPRSLLGGGSLPPAAFDPERVRAYDDGGVGPHVVLGARRLAILDRSPRGRMPMGDAEGRRFIVHNGEIYNHRALRDTLASGGLAFRSASDTEAILNGHARFGDDVVPRLRGMFAFALFETAPRPRLLLARDRLGIKPLYYHRDAERLVWASEVRALLQSGIVPDAPNPEALLRFLQLGSVPAPQTTVASVMALPAGHCLIVESDGVRMRRYWDLRTFAPERPAEGHAANRRVAAARTRALLDELIEQHLISDVPLGVFLSGGIDSSALVALAAPRRDRPLVTLSLVSDDAAHDEAGHARQVAARFGTDHREIAIDARGFALSLPGFFAAMDQPTVDGLNTYLVAGGARREGVTVALSGTGGDEVFWGYRHLRRGAWLERAERVVAALPRPARAGLAHVARYAARSVGRGGLDRLDYVARPAAPGAYLLVRGLYGAADVQELLGLGAAELDAYGPPLSSAGEPRLASGGHALGVREFTHYLENQLLRDTDVMSMAHGVEVRVPFLDHALVEHAVGLPAHVKRAGARPKPLLLDALGDALPRAVWDRPKMGFTLPFSPWLRRDAAELREQSLEAGPLSRAAVARVWDAFLAGRVHWSRPWALLALARFRAERRAAA
jgi:asparagine synthase (glutamine-hydrolysing)